MSCDRFEHIHAYHDDQLSVADRARVELHLAACRDCAELLADLKGTSRLIVEAPLPGGFETATDRYYAAWDVSKDRGLLRISSWLTAAAAAVLVGSLLLWPGHKTPPDVAVAPATSLWEAAAVMPPLEQAGIERPDELVELAQWIADDLSAESIR